MLKTRAESLTRFVSLRLLAITDAKKYGSPAKYLLELLQGAPSGSLAVLLREKESSPEQRLLWAKELLELTQKYNHHLLISDDLELVLELGADGLHCSRNYADLEAARLSLGSAWLSQGASLNEHNELSPQQESDNKLLTARLISPVWEKRKGRTAIEEERFCAFVRGGKSQEIGSTQPPLYFCLGGATAPYLRAAQSALPQMIWRAAAIGSLKKGREQAQWLKWLQATSDTL